MRRKSIIIVKIYKSGDENEGFLVMLFIDDSGGNDYNYFIQMSMPWSLVCLYERHLRGK